MAFILSPTDAALGQAVVTGQQVPQRIRQTINVESGLNDGIALLMSALIKLILYLVMTNAQTNEDILHGFANIGFHITFSGEFGFGPTPPNRNAGLGIKHINIK